MIQNATIIDFTADESKQLYYKITQVYDMPSFIKSANAYNVSDLNTLPNSSFADTVQRKFPCHTKAATWFALTYFIENKDKMSKLASDRIEQNLKKFASYWNMGDEFHKIYESHERLNKQANIVDYALTVEHNGETIRKMPIVDKDTIKMAAQYLMGNREKYPYVWRKQAAINIIKKAEKLNVSLDQPAHSYLLKAAGYGYSNKLSIANELLKRARLTTADKTGSEPTVKLAQLGKALLNLESNITLDDIEKIATIVDKYDREFNLTPLYRKGLPLPEEAFFETTVKMAETHQNDYIKLVTGNFYKKSDIMSAGTKPFQIFDENLLSDLTDFKGQLDINKVANVLPTLPRPDAQDLEKAFHRSGIKNV